MRASAPELAQLVDVAEVEEARDDETDVPGGEEPEVVHEEVGFALQVASHVGLVVGGVPTRLASVSAFVL